jgi:hypothetical protein
MFNQPKLQIVISEPDIQAALEHLRSLPFREPTPGAWDRQNFINLTREAVRHGPKVNELLEIGPGIYGVVQPFAIDLAGGPKAEGRLQVWITIRSVGTDPANLVEL